MSWVKHYIPYQIKLKKKKKNHKNVLLLGLSRPDRSPTTRPNRPTTTRFRPKPKVQLVGGGFPFSKTDTDGLSGGFASPKPEQPEPNRSYIKIRSNPTKTSQIRRDLEQI